MPSAPSGKPGKAAAAPKGRAKKPATSPVLWDWPLSRDKALQAMLTGIRADSSALFDGAHEQSRMVDVCVHAVRGEGRGKKGGEGAQPISHYVCLSGQMEGPDTRGVID